MAPAAESSGEDLAQLLQLCKELDTQPPPLRDSHAHAFFSGFPLERLFRALASAGDKDAVALVSDVLGRLLATDLGQTLLPGAAPYLAAAADAPLPALRRLAAEQYGNLLVSRTAAGTTRQQGTAADGGDGDDELASASLGQLVHILSDDPDTTVAAAAAAAIRGYVTAGGLAALRRVLAAGSPAAAALAAAAERDRGGTVRLRVLALALELAAAGGDAGSDSRLANGVSNGTSGAYGGTASASGSSSSSADERLQLLRGSGLLQPLLRTLSDGGADPLACLASLQLLEELMAASDPDSDPAAAGSSRAGQGVAVALAGLALPQLLQLLSDPMLSDAAMPLVAGIVRRSLPEALPPATAAVIASASADAATAAGDGNGNSAAEPMQVDGGASSTASAAAAAAAAAAVAAEGPALQAAPALLAAVRGVLDDAGDASAAAEACGLDALGRLAQSRAGAQLVLEDVAVARALCSRALGRSPHPEVRMAALHALAAAAGLERAGADRARAAAVLPAQYEETLRRCVYEACGGPSAAAGPSPTAAPLKRPGEVVLALLAQPFVELRLAAYRCAAALALRSWFAVELLTSPDLAARLMDAGSESGAAACNWRHAAVAALWATVSAAARGEVAGAGEEAFAATLAAPTTVDRVRQAVRAGPYGTDGGGGAGGGAAAEAARRMHEQHSVATRGGGGGA